MRISRLSKDPGEKQIHVWKVLDPNRCRVPNINETEIELTYTQYKSGCELIILFVLISITSFVSTRKVLKNFHTKMRLVSLISIY